MTARLGIFDLGETTAFLSLKIFGEKVARPTGPRHRVGSLILEPDPGAETATNAVRQTTGDDVGRLAIKQVVDGPVNLQFS